MADFMEGFWTDPWGSSGDPVDAMSWTLQPAETSYQVPDVGLGSIAASSVPSSGIFSGTSYTPSSSTDWLKSVQGAIDYGLKVSGTVLAAKGQIQDQSLNSYLKTTQADIARTAASSAAQVAGINANTAANMASLRANAANTGAVGVNLGAASGNNAIMLWLTVAGVVFAFVQVIQSSK